MVYPWLSYHINFARLSGRPAGLPAGSVKVRLEKTPYCLAKQTDDGQTGTIRNNNKVSLRLSGGRLRNKRRPRSRAARGPFMLTRPMKLTLQT